MATTDVSRTRTRMWTRPFFRRTSFATSTRTTVWWSTPFRPHLFSASIRFRLGPRYPRCLFRILRLLLSLGSRLVATCQFSSWVFYGASALGRLSVLSFDLTTTSRKNITASALTRLYHKTPPRLRLCYALFRFRCQLLRRLCPASYPGSATARLVATSVFRVVLIAICLLLAPERPSEAAREVSARFLYLSLSYFRHDT
ncbi:hypothetical protein C8Q79DRAFT_968256 [Trametes meyenii]|nr:hypothetical protein C8Q79DRAFT_968256 [Trametes meyenii]